MLELTYVVAVLLALGAAFANAAQNLFIRVGTDEGKPLDALFFVITTNVVVLLPLVAFVYYPDYGLTSRSWLSFIAAGLLGTLLGRAFMYTSIDRIGASRTAPVVASQAIVSTVLGVAFLGESLTLLHGLGVVVVTVGIAVIAWETSHENPDDLPRRELLIGLVLPFGAAFAYGLEPIFASFGFADGTPAPVGLVVKTIAASLGFTLYLRWHAALPTRKSIRSRSVRWFLFAGIANTFFLVGYYVALEIAPVNVVVPIIITNTLFVVVLSAIFMPQRLEHVTWRIAVSAIGVVVGVLAITVQG